MLKLTATYHRVYDFVDRSFGIFLFNKVANDVLLGDLRTNSKTALQLFLYAAEYLGIFLGCEALGALKSYRRVISIEINTLSLF